MLRCLCLLCCPVLFSLALAAPVPRPKEGAFEKGWGRPRDPDKDCKLTLGATSLAIEVPGKPHLLHRGGQRPLLNAPRLLRGVEGDFVAEVRVTSDWAVSLLSSDPRRGAEVR